MIGVGIDFGTSNSAAAWYDGERVYMIDLEEDAQIMPTATHLDRDLLVTTGSDAVTQYIEENRNRVVELTSEVIGRTSILTGGGGDSTSGPEAMTQNVYGQPMTDRGLPGRLFRGVKRLLGDERVKRLLVFDHPFRLVALITPVLLRIRRAVDQVVPSRSTVHIGHPVRFEGQDAFPNELALSRLEEACRHGGLNTVSFYPEPLAATLSYLNDPHSDVDSDGTVLTLDFGGGTLDLCVVRFEGEDFEVLATDGIAVGGDHIDQLIFAELLFPALGKGEMWSRMKDGRLIENRFPFEEYEPFLLNWAVTYTLNQNRFKSRVVDCMNAGGEAAEKFGRLHELITLNYSYLVFQAIKEAKVSLSEASETVLDIPELDLSLIFSRIDLEVIMGEMLESIEGIVRRVVSSANLKMSDIDVVIRTGGSSQIMAVREILERLFPGKVTEHDPFTSVAAGLAIASYRGLDSGGRAA